MVAKDEIDEACNSVRTAAVAVFDHYMTDCPGYAGKVMVVIWSGAPELHELFCWRENRLRPVLSDFAVRLQPA